MIHFYFLWQKYDLNNDLAKIRTWVFQQKMKLNSDPIKQARKVIFSPNLQNTN